MAALAAAALVLAGCSDSEPEGSGGQAEGTVGTEAPDTTTPPATEPADQVTILVTNDDGVGAPGIDALVEGLTALDGVEVVVVAPADNQSGTSDTTTDGPVTWEDATTASGYPAVAVDGTPADSVTVALDELDVQPDLVVSGVNEGQNIGPLSELSGTVGAARTAARQGVPALAVSQGLGEPPDFPGGVDLAVDWVDEHLDEAADGTLDATVVVSINVPTCPTGERQGTVEVPTATDLAERDPFTVDCTVDAPEPADDVDGFISGWAVISEVSLG